MNIDEILKDVPDKGNENKDTTSLVWKRDVLEFFADKKFSRCLEIGTWIGHTTKILSNIFDEVWSIEFNPKRWERAKETCYGVNNVNLILGDAYSDKTYQGFPNVFDVVVIDCDHSYDGVIKDINRAMSFIGDKMYLVFDDYGHSESVGVNQAVKYALNSGLKLEKYIGKPPGTVITRENNTSFTLVDWEGVIASYEIK